MKEFLIIKKLWDWGLNYHNNNLDKYSTNEYAVKEDNSLFNRRFTSESDLDVIKENNHNEINLIEEEIRELSQRLTNLFIERNKTNILDLWSLLLPLENYWLEQSLLLILSNDTSIIVRKATLENLNCLLFHSKVILSSGIYREVNKMSFISLSDKIGHVIKQLYLALFNIIRTENNSEIINPIYQCLQILFSNCNHNKLGFIINEEIYLFFQDKLKMGVDISTRAKYYNTLNILLLSDYPMELKSKLINSSDNILELLLTDIKDLTFNEAIRYEAIICICSLMELKLYPWNLCLNLADQLKQDNNSLIHKACIKLLISCIKLFKLQEKKDDLMEFWIIIIDDYITYMATLDSIEVKTTMAELLTQFEMDEFQQLKTGRKMFLITLLLGFYIEDNTSLNGSIFRALGKFASFEELKSDLTFLNDTTLLALKGIKSEYVEVKATASWCLANTIDGFINICEDYKTIHLQLPMEIELFYSIIEVGILASKDNDKLKWNGSRILGGIIKLSNLELINENQNQWLNQAIECFITNLTSGGLKVRWNTSHAIRACHDNPHFPSKELMKDYQKLMNVVLEQLNQSMNFKVLNGCLNIIENIRLFQDFNLIEEKLLFVKERVDKLQNQIKFSELKMYNCFKQQFSITLKKFQEKYKKQA
ncbi:hypothetical protein K502DRAFT_106835 [Neoconidiobolus thromboides FSU 785]|nr:hypothetical protein K502DRAFT_106835 [Neoconidiobolus thromboides FSU 785]